MPSVASNRAFEGPASLLQQAIFVLPHLLRDRRCIEGGLGYRGVNLQLLLEGRLLLAGQVPPIGAKCRFADPRSPATGHTRTVVSDYPLSVRESGQSRHRLPGWHSQSFAGLAAMKYRYTKCGCDPRSSATIPNLRWQLQRRMCDELRFPPYWRRSITKPAARPLRQSKPKASASAVFALWLRSIWHVQEFPGPLVCHSQSLSTFIYTLRFPPGELLSPAQSPSDSNRLIG